MPKRIILRCALVLAGLAGCGAAPPDAIYVNARVLTMNVAAPRAEAVAVRGERIAAVGGEAELRALAGAATEIVDLGGRALLPGFVDAHGHLLYSGYTGFSILDLRPPPIGSFTDVAAIQRALAKRAAETAPGQWIVGMGYDDTLLRERRHLQRSDLDAVSTAHPMLVFHASLHIAVANSRALALAGIDRNTPQPPGGAIGKDPKTGEPTGLLEEQSAIGPVMALQPPAPLDFNMRALRRAAARYASRGVTTAQDGAVDADTLKLLLHAAQNELLPIRVVALPMADAALLKLEGKLDAALDSAWPDPAGGARGALSGRLEFGAVKLFSDGSIQGYTGHLSQPYHIPPPGKAANYRGYPALPGGELRALATRLYAGGFQVAIHANGDAAIDESLAAIEAAQAAHPRADDRPILIHAQMARADQLERMKRLRAIPSFFVLHTYYWGERHRDIFMGPERAARMSPLRSALARGLHFTIHCDAPVVPMDPLHLVWAAVNRRSSNGAEIGPGERIGVEDALRATTIEAARQHFLEDERGSIEAGKLADLVVLSADPTAQNPERLRELQVLRTIVGGKTVFARGQNSGDAAK